MNAKKLIALLLAVVMVFGLVACGNTDSTEPSGTGESVATEPTGSVSVDAYVPEAGKYPVDYETNTVVAGSVETALAEVGGGEVSYEVYTGVAGKDYSDPEVYTYRDYVAGTTDMKWSTHTWETSDDSAILDYISSGFYTFNLNPTLDGWSVSCEMAAELPVDVTAEYVGSYGISEGETGKAWKIALNQAACWEDGTPINADSYIYSYMELLDPAMKNRRADSLYAGDFQIVGAQNYFYQGQVSYSPLGMSVADYVANGGDVNALYVDAANFWGVTDDAGNGYLSVTDDTMYRDAAIEDETAAEAYVSGKYLFDTYLNTGAAYEAYASDYVCVAVAYEDNYSWDNVGIIKTGDYELVFITVSPIENPNYYVPYNLSSTYMVYEPLWESCKTYFNAEGETVTADSDDITLITTNYCTSAETTMSYGPYKLTYFELDKQYTLERNETWYGYSDGKHVGQYQTDIISRQVIAEQATALLAFLNGELDNTSLSANDMPTYGTSEYIRYNPQSFTTKMSFNTNADSLASRGTQILMNPWFRQAFALAIDRQAFATANTSAGSPGYGLLNYMYVYDPFTGATYRGTEGAMDAMVALYGLTYGEDGDYETLEEAHDAITGYDVDKARSMMALAYEQCVADGLYDGSSEVKIQMSFYGSDDTYVKMYNFLNDALKNACVGTGFEGKVSLEMVVDADYYNTMYSGGTDIIFTTWGGAAYSPYTMLYECYCDAADGSGNQMEYGFETDKVTVTIEIDGLKYTDTLQKWAMWADGIPEAVITSEDGTMSLETFGSYDAKTRSDIFSRLEYAYLSFFTTTPIYYRNSGLLVSQKGDYAVKEYIDLVGFGGIQFYTYEYSDAQWADVVAAGLTY